MIPRISIKPVLLLQTNPIDPSIALTSMYKAISNDEQIDPIVVAPIAGGTYVILDGNNRSCAHALLDKDVVAYVISSDRHRTDILELERTRNIAPFPHPEFLDGSTSYSSLKISALEEHRRLGKKTIAAVSQAFLAQAKTFTDSKLNCPKDKALSSSLSSTTAGSTTPVRPDDRELVLARLKLLRRRLAEKRSPT